jgi:aryl-alcohol dehydrogenase-like predicted oxidoreductase
MTADRRSPIAEYNPRTMDRRQLGRTDLHISPIGFGAWAAGGGNWLFGWGAQDDQQTIEAIHRAVNLGINWIDTAAVYGLGHSEEVVRRAVETLDPASRPYVFTKCSLTWDEQGTIEHRLRPDSIRWEAEASLTRLGVDQIDLYQIHWPKWPTSDPGWDPGSYEEAWATLAELVREGKLRHIGVSNFNAEQLARIEAIHPVASLQPPYSVLRRDIEAEVLPWCQQHNVGVIVYSPMMSGLLTGSMTRERIAAMPRDDWRRASPNFREPALTRNLRIADRLREIGAKHGRSPGETAIAWTLKHPAITGAIVGARSAAQVEGFIGAAAFRLTDDEIDEIERFVATA